MSKAQKPVPVTSLKTIGGKAPEFRLPVAIKQLGGEDVTIGFTVKALRKTEWAAMRDASIGESQERSAGDPEVETKFSFVNLVNGGMSDAADLVMKFAAGWDLDDPFTHQSLVEMEDQLGGSLALTLQAYDAAIFHGRLGN